MRVCCAVVLLGLSSCGSQKVTETGLCDKAVSTLRPIDVQKCVQRESYRLGKAEATVDEIAQAVIVACNSQIEADAWNGIDFNSNMSGGDASGVQGSHPS